MCFAAPLSITFDSFVLDRRDQSAELNSVFRILKPNPTGHHLDQLLKWPLKSIRTASPTPPSISIGHGGLGWKDFDFSRFLRQSITAVLLDEFDRKADGAPLPFPLRFRGISNRSEFSLPLAPT